MKKGKKEYPFPSITLRVNSVEWVEWAGGQREKAGFPLPREWQILYPQLDSTIFTWTLYNTLQISWVSGQNGGFF